MTPEQASENLLRRIQAMAWFITENYPEEFDAWWKGIWPGKAQAAEVLNFFGQPDLEKKYVIGQRIT